MSTQSKNRPNITENIYTFSRELDSSSINFITRNESKKILCEQIFLNYVELTINNYENIEKVVSLAKIFREEVNGYNLNLATYDSLFIKVLDKTSLFLDPHFNKKSFISRALSTITNE